MISLKINMKANLYKGFSYPGQHNTCKGQIQKNYLILNHGKRCKIQQRNKDPMLLLTVWLISTSTGSEGPSNNKLSALKLTGRNLSITIIIPFSHRWLGLLFPESVLNLFTGFAQPTDPPSPFDG